MCIRDRCWNGYCPKNFGNKYYGNISLADALKNSLNTVAVQLQDIVGFDAVIEIANNFNMAPIGLSASTTPWPSGPMSKPSST